MENINWEAASQELCRRLAKFEYLANKNKNVLTYIPNGLEMAEISVKAASIYTDIKERYKEGLSNEKN